MSGKRSDDGNSNGDVNIVDGSTDSVARNENDLNDGDGSESGSSSC